MNEIGSHELMERLVLTLSITHNSLEIKFEINHIYSTLIHRCSSIYVFEVRQQSIAYMHREFFFFFLLLVAIRNYFTNFLWKLVNKLKLPLYTKWSLYIYMYIYQIHQITTDGLDDHSISHHLTWLWNSSPQLHPWPYFFKHSPTNSIFHICSRLFTVTVGEFVLCKSCKFNSTVVIITVFDEFLKVPRK